MPGCRPQRSGFQDAFLLDGDDLFHARLRTFDVGLPYLSIRRLVGDHRPSADVSGAEFVDHSVFADSTLRPYSLSGLSMV